MPVFPLDSFEEAFWAGQAIGFIEDHTGTCRKCGRERFYGEDNISDYEGYDDCLCPRCQDDREYDNDYKDFD